MSPDILLTLGILAAALVLFISERIRADLTAALVLCATVLCGLVAPSAAIEGFGSPSIITVCSIYILSAGLFKSGVANLLGRQIMRLGGNHEVRLLLAIMGVSAFLSFFVNTVGIVALMMPALMDIARTTGRSPSKLLMPLAFGSLLGGLTTPFATLTNILINQSLVDLGEKPFGLLDFMPVGALAALAGILFLAFVGRKMLPMRNIQKESAFLSPAQLRSQYHLHERMFILQLPAHSVLENRSLTDSRLGSALGLHVVAVMRAGRTTLAPPPSTVLHSLDRLLVQGTPDQLNDLEGWKQLELHEEAPEIERWFAQEIAMLELRVTPGSRFSGQTLAFLNLRREHGMNVLAVRRGARVYRSHLQSWQLLPGDTLLAHGLIDKATALQKQQAIELVRKLSVGEATRGYEINDRLFSLCIPEGSRFAGHSLRDSRIGDAFGVNVIGLLRGEKKIPFPEPDQELESGDHLVIIGRTEDITLLHGIRDLAIEQKVEEHLEGFESEKIGMVEAILSPRSTLAGKSLSQLQFRRKYSVTVLGIWQGGRSYAAKLRDRVLNFGDALLLYGPREHLKELARSRDFILLTEKIQDRPSYEKAPWALGALAVFLVPALMEYLPIHISALMGALVMVLSGCLQPDEAYAAIDIKALVIIAGMLPLGQALQSTGAAGLLAEKLTGVMEPLGPVAVIAGFFIFTSLGTCVIPAAPLVVMMAPIAHRAALEMGISPYAVLMALAMAAAGSFNSPISHPANIMIMGPGGYRFKDFLKVGVSLTLVVFVVVMLVLPIFWPYEVAP